MKTIVQLVEEQKEYFLEKDTAAKQAVEANIAPVEADASSASRAYVVGEQLFLNDVLYDVTSPISVGDAIVVNTNITAANKLSADIKSKIDDLYSKNQTLTNNVDVLFETGVKNICPPYSGSFSSNGITYIGNSDGTVTANGTCSANVGINIRVYLKAGQYKVSGCPSGGSYSTYRIGVTTDSWTLIGTHDFGNGTTITIPSDGYYRINLDVRAGYVANNLVFKPMITDVDTPESDYDHYVPYAKTNHQLTQDSVTWDNLSEVGAVNMLPNNATTQTVNGITFTVNDNGSITFSGTASINTYLTISTFTLSAGTYKLNGANGGVKYKVDIQLIAGGNILASDYSNGATFTLASDTAITARIRVESGYAISGSLTFKPMITVASYNGPYVPYAKTNKELTEELTSSLNTYYKDGISWNYGLFLEWASPSFNSVTTRLGNMTILDIFNAMPIEATSVNHAHGSSIKIGTYSGDMPLFNDIVSWFNLSSMGAGVLEIIKFEASRGLVRYTKHDSAEIYEGWIMSSDKSRRYKYSGTEIT